MSWKDEVAERGVVWAAIWDNERVRQITSSLRIVIWCMINVASPTKNKESDFSDIIRRQATPPRIPTVRKPSQSLFAYVSGMLTGWKN